MNITMAENPQVAATTALALLVSCDPGFKDSLGAAEAYDLCAYSLDAPDYIPLGYAYRDPKLDAAVTYRGREA